MIKFFRDNDKVKIEIQDGTFESDGSVFTLTIGQQYPYQAELLKKQFEKHLEEKLCDIQKRYYDQGWKDAKAKVKKRTSFWGSWKF